MTPHSLKRLPPWTWGLALFLLFCALSPGRITTFDVGVRAHIARALWAHGTVFVPPGSDVATGLVEVPGRGATSFYGIGQSLFFIPFDIAGRLLAAVPGIPPTRRMQLGLFPLVWLYVPLAGLAWWWALVWCLREWGLSTRSSLRFATLFFLSTLALTYSAQSAQEETLVGALIAGALLFWMRWWRRARTSDALLAGFLAATSLLVRLNAVFALIPLLGYALDAARADQQWRRKGAVGLAAGIAGALPVLALIAVFARWRFGHWIATGYDLASAQGLGVQWTRVRLRLAIGLLFGPGKGMLWLCPPLFIGIFFGARRALRTSPFFWSSAVLALIVSCLLCSRIVYNPDGSECWGARYQVHLLTFFLIPTVATVRSWAGIAAWRRMASAVFALGIALQLVACFGPDGLEYYQSDLLGHSRYDLIDGGLGSGQLGLRLRNLASWVAHRRPVPPSSPDMDRVVRSFFPNLWGPCYAKKMSGHETAIALVLALWIAQLGLATALLVVGWTPRSVSRRNARIRMADSGSSVRLTG